MTVKLITIKVAPLARQMLRVLAAHDSKEINEVVMRLAYEEMRRRGIELKPGVGGTKGKGAK